MKGWVIYQHLALEEENEEGVAARIDLRAHKEGFFNFDLVSNEWDKRRKVPLISILDIFVELLCNNIEKIY